MLMNVVSSIESSLFLFSKETPILLFVDNIFRVVHKVFYFILASSFLLD